MMGHGTELEAISIAFTYVSDPSHNCRIRYGVLTMCFQYQARLTFILIIENNRLLLTMTQGSISRQLSISPIQYSIHIQTSFVRLKDAQIRIDLKIHIRWNISWTRIINYVIPNATIFRVGMKVQITCYTAVAMSRVAKHCSWSHNQCVHLYR